MAGITTVNVGGADYEIQDTTARTKAQSALEKATYKARAHSISYAPIAGDTYSVALPKNTYFIRTQTNNLDTEGQLYFTTKAVTAGSAIIPGTNCTACSVETLTGTINVFVGGDSKLHFVDYKGADTVLPFSGGSDLPLNTGYEMSRLGRNIFTFDSSSIHTSSFDEGISDISFVLNSDGYSNIYIDPNGGYWSSISIDGYSNGVQTLDYNYNAASYGTEFHYEVVSKALNGSDTVFVYCHAYNSSHKWKIYLR